MADEEVSTITFDRPKRGSKDGYLQLFFIQLREYGKLISDPTGSPTDRRLVTFTQFLIAHITDDDIRDEVRKKYKTLLTEIQARPLDNEAKYSEIVEATMEVVGDVVAFYDEFLGITHRLEIGVVS